jgi:hypothetical protein
MSHDIIVKQHGGKIDVVTEPGVFTEFIVTLPRTATAPLLAGTRIDRSWHEPDQSGGSGDVRSCG